MGFRGTGRPRRTHCVGFHAVRTVTRAHHRVASSVPGLRRTLPYHAAAFSCAHAHLCCTLAALCWHAAPATSSTSYWNGVEGLFWTWFWPLPACQFRRPPHLLLADQDGRFNFPDVVTRTFGSARARHCAGPAHALRHFLYNMPSPCSQTSSFSISLSAAPTRAIF